MSSSTITSHDLTLHDVSVNTSNKLISALMKRHLAKTTWKIDRGVTYRKHVEECQRVYIKFTRPDAADEFMGKRPFQLDGRPLQVMRSLPKWYRLYDRCVTGLKIKIQPTDSNHSSNSQINESDLKKPFRDYGSLRRCQWTNPEQTEALFEFDDFDDVDKIILNKSSLKIKGHKIELEKCRTANDGAANEHPHCVHVTNLPVRVTCEELAAMFDVPITHVLVYPCFRFEQSHLTRARTSSEAWIKGITDGPTAVALARNNSDRIMRMHKIQCEAMLEPIDENELCDRFEKGQCERTATECHYKHYSCYEPDICDDPYCWYGHIANRPTVSYSRPVQRSENARYRIKLSNLPSDVTRESLMNRLHLHAKAFPLLVVQPAEQGDPNAPKIAYLIRQRAENYARQLINHCHNTPYSTTRTQKIQCQLEMNQELFEWNDFTDDNRSANSSRRTSPSRSAHSATSSRTQPGRLYSSAVSAVVSKQQTSGQSRGSRHAPKNQPTASTTVAKPGVNSLKARSVTVRHPPPSDMFDSSSSWRWTNQMVPHDRADHDEMYWLESTSSSKTNAVAKIYVTKNNPTASRRARRERTALEHLEDLTCAPQFLASNVTNEHQSGKELWTMMSFIDGERLSDYIRYSTPGLKEALQISRQLLSVVRQIHAQNVVHRDIQPGNILVERTKDSGLMLINFASAWTSDDPHIETTGIIDDQLGSRFYCVPQFERQEDTVKTQVQPCHYSPTVDTSSIGAVLFWLITEHEPKESRNINGEAPHQLHDRAKDIQKKIKDVTSFHTNGTVANQLGRQLTLIFDRAFADPDQQWSVDELDYQCQFILALLAQGNERVNYFPITPNDQTPPPIIPSGDPVVYVVLLIHYLKHQFASRYCKCMRWSSGVSNRWSIQGEHIDHHDVLIFWHQETTLSIDMHWKVKVLKDSQLSIQLRVNGPDKIVVELPLDTLDVSASTPDFDALLKSFEMGTKIFIGLLLQSVSRRN